MKHYVRLCIALILISIATVILPFGIVARVIGRLFGNYLKWLVNTVERWVKELEGL